MNDNTVDFSFQHRDPFFQLVTRIGPQILLGKQARGIATRSGAVIIIHAVHSIASTYACCQWQVGLRPISCKGLLNRDFHVCRSSIHHDRYWL